MSAEPARPEPLRPEVERARRASPLAWLREDAGLLVLAVVLTLLVWSAVHDSVVKERLIPNVEIELRIADEDAGRLGAQLTRPGERLDLKLLCSQREFHEAWQRVADAGYRIQILVRGEPQGTRAERSLGELGQDRILWPFPERLFGDAGPNRMPEGRVFRLARREVRLRLPPTRPTAQELAQRGLEAEVRVEPAALDLLGPPEVIGAEIEPDAIDLEAATEDPEQFSIPLRRALSFRTWARAPEDPGTRAYRTRLLGSFPEAVATIVLRQVEEREVQNDLVVLLDPSYEVLVQDKQKAGVLPTERLLCKGVLRGRTSALDRLEQGARQGSWFFGLRLVDSEGLPDIVNGTPGDEITKHAEIILVAGPELRDLGATFLPTAAQQNFAVTVRLRGRD